MDIALNPYTPGSGIRPQTLTGRDEEIKAFDALVTRTQNGLSGRPMVLTGLRGVGKTVLLNRLKESADTSGWLTLKFEAANTKRGRIAARQAIGAGLAKASLRHRAKAKSSKISAMLATVTSFNATIGIEGISLGVERDPSIASSGNLELDLGDTIEAIALAARDDKTAVAIFIDEMQDVDDELLEALIAVQHNANQNSWPFYLIGAGLPGTPARLASARSYAERLFDYRKIGRLQPEEAIRAFEAPAAQLGATFTQEALTHLVTETGSYPYFIQEFGSALWEVAQSSPFTLTDAQLATTLGSSRLDHGFFRSRWDRATPAEREYLVAMASDGGKDSSSSAVAQRVGRKATSLGPARANLIAKGLIYSPERGKIAYTVPSFHQYIERRAEADGEL